MVTESERIVLTRARIRILRAQIEYNHMLLAAQDDHNNAIEEIVGWVERRMTSAGYEDIIEVVPELIPYLAAPLSTDEAANNINENNTINNNDENEGIPPLIPMSNVTTTRRRPLGDITNIMPPPPPVLRRQ